MSKTFQYREPTNPEEIALFYRRLEHYLHPESRQSGDWNNTKTIAILGDSYLIEHSDSRHGKNPIAAYTLATPCY